MSVAISREDLLSSLQVDLEAEAPPLAPSLSGTDWTEAAVAYITQMMRLEGFSYENAVILRSPEGEMEIAWDCPDAATAVAEADEERGEGYSAFSFSTSRSFDGRQMSVTLWRDSRSRPVLRHGFQL